MATVGSNYDPEKYGKFQKMPEGEALFVITSCQEKYKQGKLTSWEISMDAVDYPTEKNKKYWAPVEGAPAALLDAIGKDWHTMIGKEVEPEQFVGHRVLADVFHKDSEKDGKTRTFANIANLVAAFSLKKTIPQEVKPEPEGF